MRVRRKTGERTGSLDVLRIVATILIVFHHYQQVTGATFGSINFYNGKFNFSLVVEFFFILSGFFMFHYISKIKRGMKFKEFFLKRASRLLPLVLISAVVYELLLLAYSVIFHENYLGIQFNLWGIIIDALGIQTGWSFANPCVNNPTWYISVLLLCYIVFFFATYVCKRLKVPPIYAYIFIVLLGCGIVTYGINLPFLNESSARGYYAFFFGVLLGYFMNKREVSLKLCLSSVAVIGVLTFLIAGRYSWMIPDGINFLMTFIYFPALIIIFSFKPIARLFKHKIFETVGKITYDVYIWHSCGFILMYILIGKLAPNANIMTVIAMLIFTAWQFIVGTASHYLIEKPVNKLVASKLKLK